MLNRIFNINEAISNMTDLEFWTIFTRPLVLILLFLAGFLTWFIQKRKELQFDKEKLDYQKILDKEKMDYQKRLDLEQQAIARDAARIHLELQNKDNALKAVWKLMRHFAKIPSDDSVMYAVGKDYFFRLSQAKPFIAAVSHLFHTEAHGLYLPPVVKKSLFALRDGIDKLAWENKDHASSEDIKIDRAFGKTIYQHRNALGTHLREAL